MKAIALTERELKEIQLCMYYTENLQHGTADHDRMILIASLAHAVGFALYGHDLTAPDNINIIADQNE